MNLFKSSRSRPSQTRMPTSTELRLQKDLDEVTHARYFAGEFGLRISFPNGREGEKKLKFLCTVICGQGIWKGGAFCFEFNVPPGYPFVPPTVHCLTAVYHPNINWRNGDVYLSIIRKDWKPVLSINTVFYALQLLFISPDLDHVIDSDCANTYASDTGRFASLVRQTMEGGFFFGHQWEPSLHNKQYKASSKAKSFKRTRRSHAPVSEVKQGSSGSGVKSSPSLVDVEIYSPPVKKSKQPGVSWGSLLPCRGGFAAHNGSDAVRQQERDEQTIHRGMMKLGPVSSPTSDPGGRRKRGCFGSSLATQHNKSIFFNKTSPHTTRVHDNTTDNTSTSSQFFEEASLSKSGKRKQPLPSSSPSPSVHQLPVHHRGSGFMENNNKEEDRRRPMFGGDLHESKMPLMNMSPSPSSPSPHHQHHNYNQMMPLSSTRSVFSPPRKGFQSRQQHQHFDHNISQHHPQRHQKQQQQQNSHHMEHDDFFSSLESSSVSDVPRRTAAPLSLMPFAVSSSESGPLPMSAMYESVGCFPQKKSNSSCVSNSMGMAVE